MYQDSVKGISKGGMYQPHIKKMLHFDSFGKRFKFRSLVLSIKDTYLFIHLFIMAD